MNVETLVKKVQESQASCKKSETSVLSTRAAYTKELENAYDVLKEHTQNTELLVVTLLNLLETKSSTGVPVDSDASVDPVDQATQTEDSDDTAKIEIVETKNTETKK